MHWQIVTVANYTKKLCSLFFFILFISFGLENQGITFDRVVQMLWDLAPYPHYKNAFICKNFDVTMRHHQKISRFFMNLYSTETRDRTEKWSPCLCTFKRENIFVHIYTMWISCKWRAGSLSLWEDTLRKIGFDKWQWLTS